MVAPSLLGLHPSELPGHCKWFLRSSCSSSWFCSLSLPVGLHPRDVGKKHIQLSLMSTPKVICKTLWCWRNWMRSRKLFELLKSRTRSRSSPCSAHICGNELSSDVLLRCGSSWYFSYSYRADEARQEWMWWCIICTLPPSNPHPNFPASMFSLWLVWLVIRTWSLLRMSASFFGLIPSIQYVTLPITIIWSG